MPAPRGWPAEVRPPDAPDWERTAVAWLLDLCPHDYRSYDVLRRYPVILARFARGHVAAARTAAEDGVATARAELRDVVPPEAIDATVGAYDRELARLTRAAAAVDLVAAALGGRRFATKL
ncbi:MAG: hypothetical protein ABR520_09625 [Mycobacteriales bacterium]|nr:hypothetical protein [Frankia sp.]